jgi:hypothetical protein
VRRVRGPPGSVGVDVAGTDALDSTAQRTGPCGSLGATRAADSGGYTLGPGGSWCATDGSGSPQSDSRSGHGRWSACGSWSRRGDGHIGPSSRALVQCLAPSVDQRRPRRWSRPTRAGSDRGAPGVPWHRTDRGPFSRGPGPARGTSGEPAATVGGQLRPHRLAPDRARVDGRRGPGSRWAAHPAPCSRHPRQAGPRHA